MRPFHESIVDALGKLCDQALEIYPLAKLEAYAELICNTDIPREHIASVTCALTQAAKHNLEEHRPYITDTLCNLRARGSMSTLDQALERLSRDKPRARQHSGT